MSEVMNLENIKPSFFSLCVTLKCQSRCTTCAGWQTAKERIEREVPVEEWKVILKRIYDWVGPFHLEISGGEPFLKEGIFDLIRYLGSLGITMGLTTNALALTGKCEEVVNLPLTTLSVSLNSVENPLIHIASRGRDDSFKKTMDVLQNLNYLRKKHNSPLKINLSSILMPENVSEVRPLAEFCKLEGFTVLYQLIDNGDAFAQVDNVQQDAVYVSESRQKVLEALDYISELKKEHLPIANSDKHLMAYKILIKDPNFISSLQCNIGMRNFIMDTEGNVGICFGHKTIGSLRDGDPEQLWKNEIANKIRQEISECEKKCKILACNFEYEEF